MSYKPNTAYTCLHIPTGEEWFLLGISEKKNRVCAAGHPPSMGNLSDCENIVEIRPLGEDEIKYRNAQFGQDWN